MEQNNNTIVFQVDSDIVRKQRSFSNFRIEYAPEIQDNICVVYFSSNDIYYPNTQAAFEYSILEKDRYEWSNMRVDYASKHIFLRDIFKQWYLGGINQDIDSPQKLYEWLKEETDDYKIETVGSSAGGYAAILYGVLLGARKILAFNPQFELNSLLETSAMKNPLIFRLKGTSLQSYYDLLPFINKTRNPNIFYFVSQDSHWDKKQLNHLINGGNKISVNIIRFKTSHHGIPFPKIALGKVLKSDISELHDDCIKTYGPISYSIKKIGLYDTLKGLLMQSVYLLKKKFRQRFQ